MSWPSGSRRGTPVPDSFVAHSDCQTASRPPDTERRKVLTDSWQAEDNCSADERHIRLPSVDDGSAGSCRSDCDVSVRERQMPSCPPSSRDTDNVETKTENGAKNVQKTIAQRLREIGDDYSAAYNKEVKWY